MKRAALLSSAVVNPIRKLLEKFAAQFSPVESGDGLKIFTDKRTGAHYCECHVKAAVLDALATMDAPLDPVGQPEYRANRELTNDPAFKRMQEDARKGRSFSNIVAEYRPDPNDARPLKIIGGQHRLKAIQGAIASKIDEYHGIKVYFGLDMSQRLDAQTISNTNITISEDLLARLQETVLGDKFRDWCQRSGLLARKQDFADKYRRRGPISVQMARTLIVNYYNGTKIKAGDFAVSDTTPILCVRGPSDNDFDAVKIDHPDLWSDPKLLEAAKEFSLLVESQRDAFAGKKTKPDYPEKALNAAVYSAWAYMAGFLQSNEKRLRRHYDLRTSKGVDPLNAEELATAHHHTDNDTYRGLGYRTDAKERGRLVELFFLQAEDGNGITKSAVALAIAAYHAKRSALEVAKLKKAFNRGTDS